MQTLADMIAMLSGGYGARPDGTTKGSGWLGSLRANDGREMTELTAESDIDGKRMAYPLITPNQGFRNLSELIMGMPPSDETYDNAINHAIGMRMSGRSPYKYEPFKAD